MNKDIKTLLKQAKRPETTIDVCLRGDLAATHEGLVAELEALPAKTSLSDATRADLKDRIEAVRQEMVDATVKFHLRGLPEAEYEELREAHPPRRDGDEVNLRDAAFGFNVVSFPRPLIRACVFEPELDAEDWDLLFSTALTSGERERLFYASLNVNRKVVDVPFSLADSEPSSS